MKRTGMYHLRSRITPARAGRMNTAVIAMLLLVVIIGGVVAYAVMGARTAVSKLPANSPATTGTGATAPNTSAATGEQTAPTSANTAPSDKIDAILNAVLPLRNAQEWGKCEAILQEGIRQYPEEQVLYLQLAEIYGIQSRSAESYAMFVKALAIGPREAEIELAAGTVANAAGKLDRAVEHYQAAQAARKNDWQPSLFLAQVQMKQGEFEAAKKNLLLAAGAKPDLAVAWGSLAEVLLRQNAVGPALQNIAKARELEPENLSWRLIEARALKRDGKPEAALQLLIGLDDAVKLEQGVLPIMGECFGLLKRPADAAAQYARVSDRFADKAEIALEAARWYERAGDNANAITYAKRAEYLGNEDGKKLAAELGGK